MVIDFQSRLNIDIQCLLGLTALAGYALRSVHVYSLPIPLALSVLTIILPLLAGIVMKIVLSLNEKLATRGRLQAPWMLQMIIALFLIYEAVLATLIGTYLSPRKSLTCALRESWEGLFQRKEEDCIKRIQDAFQCCGFMTTQHMAYPLPDATHGTDACVVRYERDRACFEPWRTQQENVAIMLLVVPIAVFAWKVNIFHPCSNVDLQVLMLTPRPVSHNSWTFIAVILVAEPCKTSKPEQPQSQPTAREAAASHWI